MPTTVVIFFKEADGSVPVLEWLKELRRTSPRAYAKCRVKIRRLAEMGHELRRPEADTLRDGISELRVRFGHVNYRVLYAIHDRVTAVMAHALTKEDAVPARDIDLAIARKKLFEKNPGRHTYTDGGAT